MCVSMCVYMYNIYVHIYVYTVVICVCIYVYTHHMHKHTEMHTHKHIAGVEERRWNSSKTKIMRIWRYKSLRFDQSLLDADVEIPHRMPGRCVIIMLINNRSLRLETPASG